MIDGCLHMSHWMSRGKEACPPPLGRTGLFPYLAITIINHSPSVKRQDPTYLNITDQLISSQMLERNADLEVAAQIINPAQFCHNLL